MGGIDACAEDEGQHGRNAGGERDPGRERDSGRGYDLSPNIGRGYRPARDSAHERPRAEIHLGNGNHSSRHVGRGRVPAHPSQPEGTPIWYRLRRFQLNRAARPAR